MIAYGENNQNSFFVFENRKFYDNFIAPILANEVTNNPNERFIDLFINKPLYGRIDHESDSVICVTDKNFKPNNTSIRESPFNERPSILKKFTDYDLYAMNFVVDAYEDMMKEYEKFVLLNPDIAEIFSTLEPKVAWLPHKEYYDIFVDDLYEHFRKYYRAFNGEEKIKNFNDFHNFFVNYTIDNREDFSIIYSCYTLSRYVSPNISGLIVEFSLDDHSNDNRKSKDYLNEEVYRTIMNLAFRFGFYIDRNAPWRLIANLDSPNMQFYMKKYQIDNYADFFKKNYKKTYLYDLYLLRDTLIVLYLKLLAEFPTYLEQVLIDCDFQSTNTQSREKLDLNKAYSEDAYIKLLPLYIILRGASVRSNYSLESMLNIQKKASQLYISYGKETAMKYINSLFNGYAEIVAKKEDFTPKNPDDSIAYSQDEELDMEKNPTFIETLG